MAKQKSDIVSGMGTGFEITKRLSEAVATAGGGDDDLRRILSDPALPPRLAREIMTTYTSGGPYVFRKTDWPCGARVLHLGDYRVSHGVFVSGAMKSQNLPWLGQSIEPDTFTPSVRGFEVKLGLLSAGDSRSGAEILALMQRIQVRRANALDLISVMRRYPELMEMSEISEILALAVDRVDADDGTTYVFGAQRNGVGPMKWLNAGKTLQDMGWGKIVWFLVNMNLFD